MGIANCRHRKRFRFDFKAPLRRKGFDFCENVVLGSYLDICILGDLPEVSLLLFAGLQPALHQFDGGRHGGVTVARPIFGFGRIIDMDNRGQESKRLPAPGVNLTDHTRCWHIGSVMSITVQLDLPEELIREARAFGLLETKRLTALLAEEVRRRRAGLELKEMLDKVRSAPGEPMTMEEINAEIKAARAERRAREARR